MNVLEVTLTDEQLTLLKDFLKCEIEIRRELEDTEDFLALLALLTLSANRPKLKY